jgi:hypothetical protein
MRTRLLAVAALGLIVALGACSAAGGSPDAGSPNGGTQNGGAPAANGPDAFDGNLVSSGVYAATWSAAPDAEADVFNNYNGVTLTSDHQTFGNIRVMPDGTFRFSSAAPELSPNVEFAGTGASVTLDRSGVYVCVFTVDTDLKGSRDGAVLHLKGQLSVRWHPQGIGDVTCP